MKIDPKRLRLYAVTDRAWTHDAEGLLRQVAAAVDGGAGIVQLREKRLYLPMPGMGRVAGQGHAAHAQGREPARALQQMRSRALG